MSDYDGRRPEPPYDATQEIMSGIDDVVALAERNGWNAAINACRELLPVEYSLKIRTLYKPPS